MGSRRSAAASRPIARFHCSAGKAANPNSRGATAAKIAISCPADMFAAIKWHAIAAAVLCFHGALLCFRI
jgi:hypothetical protein